MLNGFKGAGVWNLFRSVLEVWGGGIIAIERI